MKVLIALAVLIPIATAHLCMSFPKQRGTIEGLATPGADDCKLLDKDCGGRDAEPPAVILWAGMKNDIIFQKNLDHFNKMKPGAFMVNMGTGSAGSMKWTNLMTTPDTNTTSLTDYTVSVDIPDMEMDSAVIQVIYNTSNPQAPPAFYQCADVMVKKPKLV